MMNSDHGLPSMEVVDRLNAGRHRDDPRITYRQLDYWVRVGRVYPSIAGAEGPGSGRRWSNADVDALSRILDMLEDHEAEINRLSSGEMWADLHRTLSAVA